MKQKVIVGVIIGLVMIGILINVIKPQAKEGVPVHQVEQNGNTITDSIVIHIKGEVKNLGLYIMRKGSRLHDLIQLSGGLSVDAAVEKLNFATVLSDGQVIVVDKKQETTENEIKKEVLSINQASLKELMDLPGIGEAKAKSILEYRSQNGNFKAIEELMNVSGISKTIFDKIKEYIGL